MTTAKQIAQALHGRASGTGWTARCPAHDDRTPSLSITDADGRILVKCFAGCEQGAVIAALKRLGLWAGTSGEYGEHAPQARLDRPRASNVRTALAPNWFKFWNSCLPVTLGSPAAQYLTGRRCALPKNDVRWHPRCWHQFERRELPAMVGLITDIETCAPVSLHFTFLDPDGNGKAKIDRPRLYLAGHSKRGVVRLHPNEDVELGLIIGEGLETCLSYALEFAPIWACLDALNIQNFPVLKGIEGITVLVDNDQAGHRAFEKLSTRYRAAKFTDPLDIIRVQPPIAGQDLNDMAGMS